MANGGLDLGGVTVYMNIFQQPPQSQLPLHGNGKGDPIGLIFGAFHAKQEGLCVYERE